MTENNIIHLKIDNNFIAYKQIKSSKDDAPTILFHHGLMSDMEGAKALFVEQVCKEHDLNYVRFDNLGHGQSTGDFTSQTISSWLDAAEKLVNLLDLKDIIFIGSSMGGWIGLLYAIKYPDKVKGLIGIAAAPDFTEYEIWEQLTEKQKVEMIEKGLIHFSSENCTQPYPISLKLVEDGRNHLLLDGYNIDITCPVHLIHGMRDADVPYDVSMKLVDQMTSESVVLKLVKNAGHRLSDEISLAELKGSILALVKSAGTM